MGLEFQQLGVVHILGLEVALAVRIVAPAIDLVLVGPGHAVLESAAQLHYPLLLDAPLYLLEGCLLCVVPLPQLPALISALTEQFVI